MAGQYPLWILVLLPGLGALLAALIARVGPRLLGPRSAGMLAHYIGLGGSTMSLLFCAQLVQLLGKSPDDSYFFAHTAFAGSVGAVEIGALRLSPTLVGDALSASAAALLLAFMVVARVFVPSPAGQRALGLAALDDARPDDGGVGEAGALREARRTLARFALLGLLECASLVVVLAGDLGLAAVGWLVLGLAGAALVAREPGDERRGDAATRMLAWGLCGDLALVAAGLALVVGGVELTHRSLWAPLTSDLLYASIFAGFSRADLIASLLACAALVRLVSLAWTERSLVELLVDAALCSIPAVYLLLRYQRVLAYAPTVLLILLMLGMVLALVAAATALLRPRGVWPGEEGTSLGRRALGLCWVGLLCMAIGVGAWRSAALLLLAHVLTRLSLRLSLLLAQGRGGLGPVTRAIARVACLGAAHLAPGLGFAALAQTAVDVLTRESLLAPWVSVPAVLTVLFVAWASAAATARIWYEALAEQPGMRAQELDEDEDGLDFAPLLVAIGVSVVLGVWTVASWFGWASAPLTSLEVFMPLAGGHAGAPTDLQEWARPEVGVGAARSWTAGCAALVALASGYGWVWARERFHRAAGGELEGWSEALGRALAFPRRALAPLGTLAVGLCELAAQGLGRGLFEQGPRVAGELARDWSASLAPRLRAASPGAGRVAMLGLLSGTLLLLGWLYAKPEVSALVPTDDYGFGGLRPRLIRAGGDRPAGTKVPAAAAGGSAAPAQAPAPAPAAEPAEPAAVGEGAP